MSDDLLLAEQCRQAIAALERASQLPPLQVSREADIAERAVVRARDELISRLRRCNPGDDTANWRELLGQFNVALSLIAALEYPMSGVTRDSIDSVLKLLKAIPV